MDRDILLACRDASLGYEHRALLEHLTFTVRAGDYLCVVGENGSGKSTLMKSLLGLISPLAGTIDCPAQRAGAIGYLPQQTSAQRDFPATVSEVVLSGFANKRGLHFFYSAAEKSAALMNMGKLGVLELQNGSIEALAVAKGNAEMILDSNPDLMICSWKFEVAAEYEANVILITKGETALLNVVNEALAKAYADGLYGTWYEDAVALAKSENAAEVSVED